MSNQFEFVQIYDTITKPIRMDSKTPKIVNFLKYDTPFTDKSASPING